MVWRPEPDPGQESNNRFQSAEGSNRRPREGMRVEGQYGREVRRYGKCCTSGHGQRDRRMLEAVVTTDWLPL